MIKIKKLYLSNFKCVEEPKIINFDSSDINILSGPNGYGKTTIFDAIELCLTGKMNKVEYFSNVQQNNVDRTKPYYQNTPNKDVIVKLLLESNDKNYCIVKYFNGINNPVQRISLSKNNIPSESVNFFETYLIEASSNFNDDFQSYDNGFQKIQQNEIDNIFFNSSSIKIKETFYLFNYIQQEDNLFFLKKSEREKKDLISFLLNIQDQEDVLDKYNRLVNAVDRKLADIGSQIQQISNESNSEKVEYKRLFANADHKFDREKPFSDFDDVTNDYSNQIDIIRKLISFKKKFNVQDHTKSQSYKSLLDDVEKQFILDYIYFNPIVNSINIELIKKNGIKKSLINEFLKRDNQNNISNEYYSLLDDNLDAYLSLVEKLEAISKKISGTNQIISDLLSSRQNVISNYQKLSLKNNNCPLCNSIFYSLEELLEQVANKTELLNKQTTSEVKIKQDLEAELKDFIEKINDKLINFLNNTIFYDSEIIKRLEILIAQKPSVNKFMSSHNSVIQKISSINNIFATIIPVTLNELDTKIMTLKDSILLASKELYAYSQEATNSELNEIYQKYFNNSHENLERVTIDDLQVKERYLQYFKSLLTNTTYTSLVMQQDKLRDVLPRVNKVKSKYSTILAQYKKDLVSKIELPFFIYTAKILQNYKQGFGIFVKLKASGNINFVTGNDSNHDIVFHLSTGQLAVVSIAFCLVLNKVYDTNKNFKFIAIDDPVQTMDNLNIHSLIELIRHDFKGYQLILSTHDDFLAQYMKYKFDQLGLNTKIQAVQQILN
jgi:exonuclease SbcC